MRVRSYFKLRFWEIRPEALEALGPDLWKRSINGASLGLFGPMIDFKRARAYKTDDIEAPFIPSDWIGKKRVFTSDLPVAVIAAKNAVSTSGVARVGQFVGAACKESTQCLMRPSAAAYLEFAVHMRNSPSINRRT
ncbi:hypothetical protein B0H14DRAFT_2589873 [Mycena olivaceomarginata]|nr:hypothetical protein B0H14DRAFT_2589873 [Mycena olivaceomarginata]